MATTIKSTQLDFDTIKGRLKDYLKQQTEFEDYDFEASGLSNILDVLAYNTHFNGLTANFALNESFINTAQLRSSVVALAEGLGYVPSSFTSSQAALNLAVLVSGSGDRPTSITLPRGTTFSSSVDGVAYTFQTRENFSGTDDGNGTYQFLNADGGIGIPVFEGTEKTKTFFVGDTTDTQIYVIPDATMDTSTIRVRVFPSSSSTTFTTYLNIVDAIRITNTSAFYQIKETPNGFYEIIFGDGTSTGVAPVAGNKIVIDYLSTVGSTANGCTTFTTEAIVTVNNTNYNVTTSTESASAGGSFKENIESIRQNAPIAFSSQRRMVVAEDYRALVLAKFGSFLDDVFAYGGNDSVPREYGKVFIGLKFKDNISLDSQQNVKDRIRTELTDNLSIMSITTNFVDPITTKMILTTTFNLDPDLTSLTPQGMEAQVQNTINNYFATNLKRFNKVFRRSNLLTPIDALDAAILNSKMDVQLMQGFIPTLNTSLQYKITFPVTIAAPDNSTFIVTTTNFTFNNRLCFIRNKLGSNKLQIITVDGDVEIDNIGSYDQDTGVVTLVGFKPSGFSGSQIDVKITPANQNTVRPLRNFILDIDTSLSTSRAILDFQNTQVSI
jgi:hypothetical protein